MDEKVADLVPPVRCRFGRCLGQYLLHQLISLKDRIHGQSLGHRPSYYPIRAAGCRVKDTLKMG